MTRFGRGLVIGKFYPPHVGHLNLIRAAMSQCRQVDVQVLGSSVENVPIDLRMNWIREEVPMARVVGALDDHVVDYDSADAWAAHLEVMRGLLDGPIDAVFTSDTYGAELAERLGATWVQVEPERQLLGLSGTRVRADPERYWWGIPSSVRAWLVRRVAVVGAESTGTTTLAQDLGGVLGVPVVEEFGRQWSADRPGGLGAPWASAEFDLIAREQARTEDDAARLTPRPWLVCDTDVLATCVWHERYVGTSSASVDDLARARVPALYVLTGDEIDFVQDGLRDGEHLRPWMTQRFRDRLSEQAAPWIEVDGPREHRVAQVLEHLSRLPMHQFSEPLAQRGGESYA